MKEKNDCKIVQDLLPNYIDKLTSKETNTYIEEHVNGCKNCKKILDAMQKDILVEDKKIEKKKIKYIKKYNHKLRILKTTLLLIILIIVVLFVAFPGKNMMIIASLGDKFEIYNQKSDNVYIKTLQYDSSNKLLATIEYYYKDGDIKKYIMTNPEADIKFTEYFYPNESKLFIEEPKGKTLSIESREEDVYTYPLMNFFYYDSLKESFMIGLGYDITTGDINGKECYIFNRKYTEQEKKLEIYIEKDTGLVLKTIQTSATGEEEYTIQYEYSFGTVTDEDMQEPDATEYTLEENN